VDETLSVVCKECGSQMIGTVVNFDTIKWECPNCGHVCGVDVEEED
jgi:transposase